MKYLPFAILFQILILALDLMKVCNQFFSGRGFVLSMIYAVQLYH